MPSSTRSIISRQPSPWLAEIAIGSPSASEWKSARDDVRVEAFRLVDREEHRLARRGAVPARRSDPAESGPLRASTRSTSRSASSTARSVCTRIWRLDAGWVLDETAGIDGDVGNRAEPPESVLAVAGDAGHVRDDRIARARQCIEQRRLADVRAAYECDDGKHDVLIALPRATAAAAERPGGSRLRGRCFGGAALCSGARRRRGGGGFERAPARALAQALRPALLQRGLGAAAGASSTASRPAQAPHGTP